MVGPSSPVAESVPVLGLMLGDHTGIGPELCARVLADHSLESVARLLVIGDARVMRLGAADAGVDLTLQVAESPERVVWDGKSVPIIDLGNADPKGIVRGALNATAGRTTRETLVYMTQLALEGRLDGITFAPLNKKALSLGGSPWADEHAMFADLTGYTGSYRELNVLDNLWTCSVTTHIPFRDIVQELSVNRILNVIVLVHGMLQRVGVEEPRILVSALNPHGGDGGLFGDEEQVMIGPAIDAARERGIGAEGPYPGDTIFRRAFDGRYDSVISMYHDQGRIATKLTGFMRGVTVTGGLPVVFTTPAHGTAFDIVGQGIADPGALDAALKVAARLAVQR